LGPVRIHRDAEAAELATALGARAFTTGNDIFFNTGVYDPSTSDGYSVLTHELTHTLQQSAGPVAGRQVATDLTVSDPGDADERAAQATAQRITAARAATETPDAPTPPAPGPSGAGAVQRAVTPSEAGAVQRTAAPPGAGFVQRAATPSIPSAFHVQRDVATGAGPVAAPAMVQREGESGGVSSLLPDFILDEVKDAVSIIPGYTLLTYIAG
jgi:hypothetical protein